jgi:hypothetical protein
MFWRNIPPPSSRLTSKPNKQAAACNHSNIFYINVAQIRVFRDVTLCSLADGCQGFGGNCCYTFSLPWRWRQRFLGKISNYAASSSIKLQFLYLSPRESHISKVIILVEIFILQYTYVWMTNAHTYMFPLLLFLYCSHALGVAYSRSVGQLRGCTSNLTVRLLPLPLAPWDGDISPYMGCSAGAGRMRGWPSPQ